MPKFRALLRGEDFPIVTERGVEIWGFYTTRTVRAKDEDEAELAAVALIKSDGSLLEMIDRSAESEPMIYLEALSKARWWNRLGGAGYTFYPMEESDEDGDYDDSS